MDTKLTLKLDRGVIEKAKLYAEHRGVSLSRVVESYFLGLTRDEEPASRELTGVVAQQPIGREEYTNVIPTGGFLVLHGCHLGLHRCVWRCVCARPTLAGCNRHHRFPQRPSR